MERVLQERLVGAVVLVLVGIVVLPWALDGRREPQTVNETLTLPAPSEQARTHTMQLGESQTTQPQPIVPPPVGSNASNARTESATPPAQTEQREAPPQTSPRPTRTESEPVATPPPPAATVAKPPPATAPAATPEQGWAVQVGSFASKANGDRLAGELRAKRYAAFVVRNVVAGNVRYRVRVGPEREREQAAALAERLRADGQQTAVVPHP